MCYQFKHQMPLPGLYKAPYICEIWLDGALIIYQTHIPNKSKSVIKTNKYIIYYDAKKYIIISKPKQN